ncbi:hypothetical protein P7K49_004258 [Saguinus oedipus]|uniref:Uncharacterized protein n=1 Tax=Saguinus oedipus TaxID=9490 RepID=A0ABQ9W6V7_SAGOE|nr:hypothetical protein P7K49_004258 [Saguinus oedipus]
MTRLTVCPFMLHTVTVGQVPTSVADSMAVAHRGILEVVKVGILVSHVHMFHEMEEWSLIKDQRRPALLQATDSKPQACKASKEQVPLEQGSTGVTSDPRLWSDLVKSVVPEVGQLGGPEALLS